MSTRLLVVPLALAGLLLLGAALLVPRAPGVRAAASALGVGCLVLALVCYGYYTLHSR